MPGQDFAKVQSGMDKHSVLQIMGSPDTTLRRSGQDRWYYNYYEQNTPITKEVRFQEGLAVYSGDPVKPALSAADEDKRNEESNLAIAKEWERTHAKSETTESHVGTQEEESSKFIPSFEPVR